MIEKDKTRVLIFGGSGMLGHKLWLTFRHQFETLITLRLPFSEYSHFGFFEKERTIDNVDLKKRENIIDIFEKVRPEVLINCVGIIKQLPDTKDPALSIKINSLLPHELEKVAKGFNAKLIHISTDCIFEGGKGNYSEEEPSRVDDLYGLTKLLGEVSTPPTLTLRTSIIGRELVRRVGLLEWFLQREPGETVRGYTNAIFSGFTTPYLAKILAWIIKEHRDLTGIYHLSSHPISKYDLLKRLQKAFGLAMDLQPCDDFHCNRSLNSNRFNKATSFLPPSWNEMIEGLKEEDSFYKEIQGVARR